MQSTLGASVNKEKAMSSLLDRSYLWLTLSLVFALPSGLLTQPNLRITAGAIGLAIICALCALYLLRHYNFWYSWLWWLPLLSAFFLVVDPMRTGALSIPVVIHGLTLGSSLMFGAFWHFRKALRKWAG